MRVDEIKARYPMRDILARCGLETKRGGFCKCPFHVGDHTPSMKVYDDGFYCFACGKGGDQIAFVRQFHNLNFKEACEWISGETLTKETRTQVAVAVLKRQQAEKTKKRLQEELRAVGEGFTGLWQTYLRAEPFSDDWTNAYNKWQLLCYQQEELINQLGEL